VNDAALAAALISASLNGDITSLAHIAIARAASVAEAKSRCAAPWRRRRRHGGVAAKKANGVKDRNRMM